MLSCYAVNGGELGIRTLETLLGSTHFPGVRLRPLGHLSIRGTSSDLPHAGAPGQRSFQIRTNLDMSQCGRFKRERENAQEVGTWT